MRRSRASGTAGSGDLAARVRRSSSARSLTHRTDSVIQTMRMFSTGQRVLHTGKPEWGSGVITEAMKTTQDGKPCQRLTIRFDRAGLKTISTAFATLIPAEDAAALAADPIEVPRSGGSIDGPTTRGDSGARSGGGGGASDKEAEFAARLMGAPASMEIRQRMTRLPEPATDPFLTVVDRLKNTIGLYRFQPTGASLLDWAAMQSGLSDPMSRFNRHELEKFFESFAIARDQHLKKVAGDARKLEPEKTAALLKGAPAMVQQVLRRFDAMR